MNPLDLPHTLLFTSVGNEALHGFVQDLRVRAPKWRLLGVDTREDAAGRYLCDEHWTCPRRDDSAFAEFLQALVREHKVSLVVPLSTEDQDWFCRSHVRAALSPAVVLTSTEEAVRIANHKTALFEFLSSHPHLLPDFRVVGSAEEALGVVERLVVEHGAALVKSDASTGGRGMFCVGTPPEERAPSAGRSFMPIHAWRELARSGPALRAAVAPSVWGQGARWPQLVVGYLPGDEYSVDVLCERGETLAAVVRLRTAAVGGLAVTAEVVDAPDVVDAAREVVRAVGLSHVVNVQFRRDNTGMPKLLEVNPRTPGTIGLTVAAGFNLPLAAFVRALGGELALGDRPQAGLRCFRYHGMVLSDGRRL